jgi:fatty acid desaturase
MEVRVVETMRSPSEIRSFAAAKGLTAPDPWGYAARTALLLVVHGLIVGAGFAIGGLLADIIASGIAGLTLFGIAIGGHEGINGSVSRRPFVNTVVGTLAAAVVAVPYATYKRLHLEHHSRLNTDRDPEGNVAYSSLAQYAFVTVVFGCAFVTLVWLEVAKTAAGRSEFVNGSSHRQRITINNAVSLALVTVSNWPTKAAPFHLGCHAAHHIAPGVPGRRLPELERLAGLTPSAEYTTGYLAFQRDLISSVTTDREAFSKGATTHES